MAGCGHPDAGKCLAEYTAERIGVRPRERMPWKYVGGCPECGGADKLSVEPGAEGAWIIWTCHRRKRGEPGWCDPHRIREHLLHRVSAQHLGGFARYPAEARHLTRDEQLADALAKIRAIERALRADHSPADLRVQIGAVLWTGGAVPRERSRYLALAEDAGVGRTQRYEAWARRAGVVCDSSSTPPAKGVSSDAGQRGGRRPETGRTAA